jgi:hypothetical protein
MDPDSKPNGPRTGVGTCQGGAVAGGEIAEQWELVELGPSRRRTHDEGRRTADVNVLMAGR